MTVPNFQLPLLKGVSLLLCTLLWSSSQAGQDNLKVERYESPDGRFVIVLTHEKCRSPQLDSENYLFRGVWLAKSGTLSEMCWKPESSTNIVRLRSVDFQNGEEHGFPRWKFIKY
jgi:hypothetical protein